jgi:AmmeMemoRadiSam system protein B
MSQVRSPVVAGAFYPGAARQLERQIGQFFAKVEPTPIEGEIVGLISPHAGYVYSGQTAAHAYAQVRGASFDVVAVISPLHQMALGRFATSSADAYETPLGTVPLNEDLVAELQREIHINRVPYDGEHSLEVQIPFLQVALTGLTLLPVMIGDPSFAAGEELGAALARILAGHKALIVASTDMHHIPDYAQVVRRDQAVIDALATFDLDRIKSVLSPWDCSVCGRVPVYAMLTAAQALGADGIRILHHTTSGDVTGVRTPGQYTVGYLAAAVYKGGPAG